MKSKKKIIVTVPVIIIIAFVVSTILGGIMFNQNVKNDLDRLFAASKDISNTTFTYDQIIGLPEPVQRYFKFALQEGQNYISNVKLNHNGTFRQGEGHGWIPVKGEEYFTADRPGFIWSAKLNPFPLFWISGKDVYIEGKGNLQIKILSLFTIADAKGKETDEGELLRWISEAVWFPTALLPGKYVQWEEIDSSSAKVVVNDNGLTVTAIFYFNNKDEITKISADRYRMIGNSYSKDKWVGYASNYTKINNIMIPQQIEATWQLKSGELSYAKFNLINIEFNKFS